MITLLFPNLAKCWCDETIDQSIGKGKFFMLSNSCTGPLKSNQYDLSYRYIVIENINEIPDSWVKSTYDLTTVESKDVRTIGSNAFRNAPNLQNVILTASGSGGSIGAQAFYNLNKLQKVTLGSAFSSIGASCFNGCTNLQVITFSDSQNSISISSNAFANCNSLTSLTIGRPISSSYFPGWTNLQSITITSNYFSSPYSVFSECSSFLNIFFSSSVSSIKSNAFKSWIKISSITFPSTIETLNSNCFDGCTNLQEVTFVQSELHQNDDTGNIRFIGDFAFRKTNLTVLNLLHCYNLQSIGNRAFADIESLQYVYLPHATTIGHGCFENCINLSDVSLPMKITEIQESVFENCSKLVSIPVPTNVECFKRRAFYGSGLESIRIGYMVTVYSEAFACCDSLQRVELFDYAVVANKSFSNSNQISSLVIYEYVTIYSDAFSKVSNLSYFGLTDVASPITEKFLKSMNIQTIYVIEDYRYGQFCNIIVTKQKANTEVCINEKKCSMAPYYSEHLRMAMMKKRR